MRGAPPSIVLPTPHTSLVLTPLQNPRAVWARPSNAVRALTRARPRPAGPSGRRHVKRRGRYPLQQPPRRPLELLGHRRDLRKAKDDAQDNCHARCHDLQYPQCTFYSSRPLCAPDSGKNDDFSPLPYMYTAPPCVYKRGRRSLSYLSGQNTTLSTTHRAHTLLSPDIDTCLNQFLL